MTGNVLRDYLTDLFPILELGTLGEDALGRAPARRWWGSSRPGLAARRQARPAVLSPRTTCAGTPSVSSPALGASPSMSPRRPATPRPRSSPTPSTPPSRPLPRREQVPGSLGRPDRQPRLALHLALYWAGRSRRSPRTRARRPVRAGRAALAVDEDQIQRRLIGVQGHLVDLGGTTVRHRQGHRGDAAGARPSTRSSTRFDVGGWPWAPGRSGEGSSGTTRSGPGCRPTGSSPCSRRAAPRPGRGRLPARRPGPSYR